MLHAMLEGLFALLLVQQWIRRLVLLQITASAGVPEAAVFIVRQGAKIESNIVIGMSFGVSPVGNESAALCSRSVTS